MAGNHRSGRKPNPPLVNTEPIPMPRITGEARKFWLANIEPASHLTPKDADLARACCELWALYRAAHDVAAADPCDKDARIAVTNYFATFKVAMQRLRLDPMGREKAAATVVRPDTDSPLREFGIVS